MKERAGVVSPTRGKEAHQLTHIMEEGDGLEKDEVEKIEVVEEECTQWGELVTTCDKLVDRIDEQFGKQTTPRPCGPAMAIPPLKPTREEWQRHQLTHTHTPFQVWCPHCVPAKAVIRRHPEKGRHHERVPETDGSIEGPVKISMDFFYLHERATSESQPTYNPPHLVVTEHRQGRIWAYRVPNKGVMGDVGWLPGKVIQDISNNGMKDLIWHVKAHQEPSIVALQTALQTLCDNRVIPTNSPVGESACNGRAENAVRRVQEKVRTLKHQMENCMKSKLPGDSPVMAWLVRWAAELLSKHAVGEDNQTPYQRIRKEECVMPYVPFGEKVL